MKEQDFLSDSLWQLLDELIEAHNSVSPDCIFRFGTKRSTRETAENLLQIMPHFAKRLRQRDYDMMFIQPRLRRCLLKMYCLSAFVHDASGKRHTGARFVPPQLDWNKVENEAYWKAELREIPRPSTARPRTGSFLSFTSLSRACLHSVDFMFPALNCIHDFPVHM
eukprot:m.391202 g.391202  ORF g.391202 m.391202 type:complete len:166 (-) comp56345_c0_seq9:463-960(-)